MRHFLRITPAIFLFAALACGRAPVNTTDFVTREILPNGAVEVRYTRLSDDEIVTLEHDLQIGVMDGEPEYIFGDIRGIEAGSDGTIYVFDYQASEVRAYDEDGLFLRMVASKGEGPGEISAANGIILVKDSILWIHDHGKWIMTGIDIRERELITAPVPVRSRAYIYSGTVDNSGRIWKSTVVSDAPPTFPPTIGISTGIAQAYFVNIDSKSHILDSLDLGQIKYRGFVSRSGSGYAHYGIPNDPRVITRVDPDGGFWRADDHLYRIAQLGARSDTVLVIDVQVEPVPVTEKDRREYIDRVTERSPDQRIAAETVAGMMLDFKPILEDLIIDDVGRLWVERAVGEGENPRFDVFERDGTYQGSVTPGFNVVPYLPIRVRHDRIYALSVDSLGVPSVMRTPPIQFSDL